MNINFKMNSCLENLSTFLYVIGIDGVLHIQEMFVLGSRFIYIYMYILKYILLNYNETLVSPVI